MLHISGGCSCSFLHAFVMAEKNRKNAALPPDELVKNPHTRGQKQSPMACWDAKSPYPSWFWFPEANGCPVPNSFLISSKSDHLIMWLVSFILPKLWLIGSFRATLLTVKQTIQKKLKPVFFPTTGDKMYLAPSITKVCQAGQPPVKGSLVCYLTSLQQTHCWHFKLERINSNITSEDR